MSEAQVFYDGDCAMCKAMAASWSARDTPNSIEFLAFQGVDLGPIDPRLNNQDCERAMHLLTGDGRLFVGYDAVVKILSYLPRYRFIERYLRLPGVTNIGRLIYRQIAKRRKRKFHCDDSCRLHF